MTYLISTPPQLSHALRSARKKAHLSQLEAGKPVGLLQKSVSILENHPETARIESLFKLLSALGLELVIRPKDERSGGNSRLNDAGEW
jgi:HTH-type transcriptional regulator/antitoxin HipB